MPLITFNQRRGAGIFATATKSQIDALVAYCDDLVGCGVNTHARKRLNGNFNSVSSCQPPRPMFQASLSSIGRLDFTATDLSANIQGTYNYLAAAIFAAIAGAPFIDPPDAAIGAGVPWEFRGDWLSATANDNQVARMSLAQVTTVFDQCGLLVGRKGVTSYSFSSKDPVTCRPRLDFQVSVSAFITSAGADVAQTAAGYQALLTQSTLLDIYNDVPDAPPATACPTLPGTSLGIVSGLTLPYAVTVGV